MKLSSLIGRSLFLVCVALTMSGCALFAAGAGAAAGAGSAIYLTTRGVEANVPADLDRTFTAAQQAFRDMDITQTEVERDTETATLKGVAPERDLTVTVTMEERADDLTHVDVEAKEGMVNWDKEFARQVMQNIVEQLEDGEPVVGATGEGSDVLTR